MSKQLVESIVSQDLLQANDIVEAKLNEIRERKLYEMKRMYAAESIGNYKVGGNPDELRKKGYRPAAEELARRAAAAEKAKRKAKKWLNRHDDAAGTESEIKQKKKESLASKVVRNVVSTDIIDQLKDIGTSNLR